MAFLLLGPGAGRTRAEDPADLRLVPFPKEVRLAAGRVELSGPLVLEVSRAIAAPAVDLLIAELRRAGLEKPEVRWMPATPCRLALWRGRGGQWRRDGDAHGDHAQLRKEPESYVLEARPAGVVGRAPQAAGLIHALQTLRQLVRANRRGTGIPCLTISDWPSLRWRAFQDDVTRGPSPTSSTLQFEAEMGSYLKMNLFTYYMESQYAFRKHPMIGPKDGSLEPRELAALVAYARPLAVDILGNQQSFGHFGNILKFPQFADLRETGDILCPVKEGTYRLLDDLYSEVCPLLPFPMFNVCCDETFGLGTGPARPLAEKIGVGGVYVRHICRLHDLVTGKYHKRMMMWGDIILLHPEHLSGIPKDTVMLTWAYDPRANFESQIVPFARSGFEFFVCPGVGNWNCILPDFGAAVTNIRNFVRDGLKHGAIGMLNTDWKDDGESLHGPVWHGNAWGAECAWNGSATSPELFNRRIGAVMFGEKGDHFGQAVELLSRTHRMPAMRGLATGRFWENDFVPQRSASTIRPAAEKLLEAVRPAIRHLRQCRAEATVHARWLDSLLFGARRAEWIGQRMLDGQEATLAYQQACEVPAAEALPLVDRVRQLARKHRGVCQSLGNEFQQLWLSENKPYALDGALGRYAGLLKWYDDLDARLLAARQRAEAGQPLPIPEQIGLALSESFARRSWPHHAVAAPLRPDTPWAEPSATHRLGLVVRAGAAERFQLPVELALALPPGAEAKAVRAFRLAACGAREEILAQLDPPEDVVVAGNPVVPGNPVVAGLLTEPHPPTEGLTANGDLRPGSSAGSGDPRRTRAPRQLKSRLTLVIPGPIPKDGQAEVHVYLGLPRLPARLPQAVSTRPAPHGMHWIENDKLRLLLGPEGGHVYRWEVKARGGRNLAMPGETDWHGFSDLAGDYRRAANTLVCVARGPALVRYRCTDPSGLVKYVGLFGGAAWMEAVLPEAVGTYWDFDNPENFAAEGPSPGEYLFSTGKKGAVGRESAGVSAQVDSPGAQWVVKFRPDRLALGLCTPEVGGRMCVAPGSGAGGVGIEGSVETRHFITFGGVMEADPCQTMTRLCQTLDYRAQPEVILFAAEMRR
jgi:hypothetical protein